MKEFLYLTGEIIYENKELNFINTYNIFKNSFIEIHSINYYFKLVYIIIKLEKNKLLNIHLLEHLFYEYQNLLMYVEYNYI